MKSVLKKIYSGDFDQAVEGILKVYSEKSFCVVNFVYFGMIVAHKLLDNKYKTKIQNDYKKSVLSADFLLPDGIALQIFYFFARLFGRVKETRYWLSNLNGTDFVEYFLNSIKLKYGSQKINLILYGTKDKYLVKVVEYMRLNGYNVIYYQNGFSEFDWDAMKKELSHYQDSINILLQARSTVDKPIQELWAIKNIQKIKNNSLLIMNVAGLFDFWAGAQKRGPKIIRTLKMERLFRFLKDPKRNYKKVLYSLGLFKYILYYLVLKKRLK